MYYHDCWRSQSRKLPEIVQKKIFAVYIIQTLQFHNDEK